MTATIDQVRTYTGTQARLPDESGYIERDGVRVWWESYGGGSPAVMLLPTWSLVHSRHYKAQIPYLARHYRVITFDGRGNGFSDRPMEVSAYRDAETIKDAVEILDLLGIERVVAVGDSCAGRHTFQLAAWHPERVLGVFAIGPSIPKLAQRPPWREEHSYTERLETDEGWAKDNVHYRRRDYRGFAEFFFGECFNEPHSTKPIEDCVKWALDTDNRIIERTECDLGYTDTAGAEALCRAVECPVVVVHGTDDRIVAIETGERAAALSGGRLVAMEGSGHLPNVRDPVKVNLLIRDFVESIAGRPTNGRVTWTRARHRPKQAMFVSSPIGLGHVWRDVRIADELRERVPGLEVHWLAQHPVTEVLRARGETIHPASAELASESEHVDSEAGEHHLHAFQAIRRMDEIFVANFMLFHDVVTQEPYDLWIGDEAWELDKFLHENPELKTAPYAWLSDFVGMLPMPSGGDHEAFLTADENADMIELVERNPRVRDAALYVGEPDELVDTSFGPGLPGIRDWTERHFQFTGYVPAFDPGDPGDRAALRGEHGWGDDEVVCLVSVGGSGTGESLLRRAAESLPLLRERVPGLRMVAVAGPRIDPGTLPDAEGLEVRGYVHELHRLSRACDVAIVQGGLTSTMELVAAGRPFVAVPLEGHFEQQLVVRHRLDRYGARAWLPYAEATPEALAGAVARELAAGADYRPVTRHGAARAAAVLAPLVGR
jgi:pimeloyl-ACP methyl ester carboxylesterase/predicted glycosyltransferase